MHRKSVSLLSSLQTSTGIHRATNSYSSADSAKEANLEDMSVKPFSAVPGLGLSTVLMKILKLPKLLLNMPSVDDKLGSFKQFGPMYKTLTTRGIIVRLADAEATSLLFRRDGIYPDRGNILKPWIECKNQQNLSHGPLTSCGKDWKQIRSLLDKQMLKPRTVQSYAPGFNEIIDDFVGYLQTLKEGNDHLIVPNLSQELQYWALESTGYVLFDTRLGCIKMEKDAEMRKLIGAATSILFPPGKLIYYPMWINYLMFRKYLNILRKSWKIVFSTAQIMVDARISRMTEQISDEANGTGVIPLLLSAGVDINRIYGAVADIIMAASDTSSYTLRRCLSLLAVHPKIQEKIHKEIENVLPGGRIATADDLQNLPLIKGTIKEVLRIYPPTNVHRRTTVDMVLCDYHIPAGTLVEINVWAMGRDIRLFNQPEKFIPERWLRIEGNEQLHRFSWLPFGHGLRACVGRRIAELQIQLLLTRFCQLFEIKPVDNADLSTPLLLSRDRPAKIKFVPRYN